MAHLPEHVRRKVENHPCYSEEAHHHYARMHVAVAPACNIQCHYCNRKYDCANESRPGVVSEVLKPAQAVNKAIAVAAKVPQLAVVGIAGPGDPLANPKRTFETCRLLSEKAPDLKLCLSTNGLALPDHVDALARYHVEHVTITINSVDPAIGAEIHPWVLRHRRRLNGEEGAEFLIERQQKGLEMLVERGVLVKVNSVMIPGVNDAHLKEVSRIVRDKGAFIHNVMPLISEEKHGTLYGLTGQRGPTYKELRELQDACSGDVRVMRHCRQCRADAVGMLGEDLSDHFTMDKVERMDIDYDEAMQTRGSVHAQIERERESRRRHPSAARLALAERRRRGEAARPVLMAVASSGGGLVNQHFGHALEFLVYEASLDQIRFVGHRKVELYCSGVDRCGEEETVFQRNIRALAGCEAVLCSKIGHEPRDILEQAGIIPNGEHAMEPIEGAVAAVYAEMIDAGLADAPSSAALAEA